MRSAPRHRSTVKGAEGARAVSDPATRCGEKGSRVRDNCSPAAFWPEPPAGPLPPFGSCEGSDDLLGQAHHWSRAWKGVSDLSDGRRAAVRVILEESPETQAGAEEDRPTPALTCINDDDRSDAKRERRARMKKSALLLRPTRRHRPRLFLALPPLGGLSRGSRRPSQASLRAGSVRP